MFEHCEETNTITCKDLEWVKFSIDCFLGEEINDFNVERLSVCIIIGGV